MISGILHALPEIRALKRIQILRHSDIHTVQSPGIVLKDGAVLNEAHRGLASRATRIRGGRGVKRRTESRTGIGELYDKGNQDYRDCGRFCATKEWVGSYHVAAV